MADDKHLTLREFVLFAILGSLTFAAKVAMAGFPNIEPASLLVMLFAVTFGFKAVYPIYIYVALELAVYGFGLWTVGYLYLWGILAAAAWRLRNMTSALGWGILSGVFGLFFGALYAPVYFLAGGSAAAFSWWVSGIPYDILHCAGNFLMALVLFVPLRGVLHRFYVRYK